MQTCIQKGSITGIANAFALTKTFETSAGTASSDSTIHFDKSDVNRSTWNAVGPVLENVVDTAETQEGKFVAEMDEGLDTLKGLFTEALDDAARNYQRAVGTATETIESAAQTVNEAVETVEQITKAVEEKIENADEEKPTAALEAMAEAAQQIAQVEQTINEAEQKVDDAVEAVEEAEAKLDEGADKTATQEVREQAEEAKKEINVFGAEQHCCEQHRGAAV